MVKNIVKDVRFLKQKSAPASKADLSVAQDLIDTLAANREICAGMAANMIGAKKRIIIAATAFAPIVMLNPVITAHSEESYEAEEGCLSLVGQRKTRRYESIEVSYTDMNMQPKKGKYSGFLAQVIQHEMDHLDGIII